MDAVYVLTPDGSEWEDLTIFTNLEDAIAISKKYPNTRVEIFTKTQNGYVPSYAYYLDGNKKNSPP
jgi:hypothetical protein